MQIRGSNRSVRQPSASAEWGVGYLAHAGGAGQEPGAERVREMEEILGSI